MRTSLPNASLRNAMKTLVDHLAQYAAYHRDPRNLVTHFVGIPMIVVAVTVLLARPLVEVGGIALSPAVIAALAATIWYLRLDLALGLAMALFLGASVAIAQRMAAMSTGTWLACGIGVFVIGWAIQFVGHHYEGRKPAFVDDVVGLLVGPLFIAAETAFALGMRLDVKDAIEARVGPMRVRERVRGSV